MSEAFVTIGQVIDADRLFQVARAAWHWEPLAEVCRRGGGDIQTGPFGTQLHASDYMAVGVPSIMPQNISNDRVDPEGIARISPRDAKRLSRYLVEPGDIVYSRRGDVERRALITEKERGWLCGTGCLRVRFGAGLVDPLYASYFLSHPASREWVVRHAVGATMPNLNTSILGALPFLLPPHEDQLAIASVLGAIDEKIEQNRRTALVLERLARTIFRAWFVDFEPVKAKAAGATAFPFIPQPVFDTLPTRFVDSVIGPVPEGWEVKAAADAAIVAIGRTPPRKEPQWFTTDPSQIPWASIRDMGTCGVFIDATSEYLTREAVDRFRVRLIPDRSVLFSFKLTLGRVAIADGEIASNEAIAHFIPRHSESIGTEYLYCHLAEFDHTQLGSTSSIATATNSAAIKGIPILFPASSATVFTELVRPMFDVMRSLTRESKNWPQRATTCCPSC